mgnify:CR=1 FL=1
MTAPQIIVPDVGLLNRTLEAQRARLERGKLYRNAATVCLIPTRGMIHARVIQSWFALMAPMNHPFLRLFLTGMEVGAAYTQGVDFVLAHPDLSTWPYLLTLEEDNMPPPDGLLKLIEAIDGGVDGTKYDAVGGLYWTKGEGGQAMIYGDPLDLPLNFRPQPPKLETIQPANGLGMGFTLFRLSMFKDKQLDRPWFQPAQGLGGPDTQDLHFFERVGRLGYKFACDTRCRVGHFDASTDTVW